LRTWRAFAALRETKPFVHAKPQRAAKLAKKISHCKFVALWFSHRQSTSSFNYTHRLHKNLEQVVFFVNHLNHLGDFA
jgi:hypothetical protein